MTVKPLEWYRTALECLIGVPATDGNEVVVLRTGGEAFAAMLDEIRAATAMVDLHTFAHWNGRIAREFTDALADRARAGVRIRILLDAYGARRMDHGLIDQLRLAGADVQWFRPLTNWRITQSTHRGHRKLLICDHRVAFTGGVGLDDQWDPRSAGGPPWRDTHVRVRGPAANGLSGAFVNNWAETGRPLFDTDVDPFPEQGTPGSSSVQVVRGDAETGWGDISTLVRSFVGLARERLRISASYFVPDAQVLALLAETAERGVSVELLRPGAQCDSRLSQAASDAQTQPLLDAGVRIWSYQPAVLQAKVMTVDGCMAGIGPANFNARSLTLDDEVNVVVFDPAVVSVLDAHFDDDLNQSGEISSATWARRPTTRKAAEALPGFLARHL